MVEGGTQVEFKRFLNKHLVTILDDGGRFPTKKEGTLTGVTETHLILKINSHEEGILISRIIRWEVNNGSH